MGTQSVRYDYADTSLGRLIVAWTDAGVCFAALGDCDEQLLRETQSRLRAPAITRETDAPWVRAVAGLLEDPLRPAEVPLDICGTKFQQEVWQALRGISPGQTASYAQIAESIGRPSATRAVASACGANPVLMLVPCHRVLGSDGSLRGYRWGVERKRTLLERESAP
ncbi:MAG: methylated-DNA--[protein]-cysteine S-methyltransferase [Actinobacteria bacterium]|nr:methylated-DNA--[protein]-cysteine S-methyltransferase [Actinomycetota bacterium]